MTQNAWKFIRRSSFKNISHEMHTLTKVYCIPAFVWYWIYRVHLTVDFHVELYCSQNNTISTFLFHFIGFHIKQFFRNLDLQTKWHSNKQLLLHKIQVIVIWILTVRCIVSKIYCTPTFVWDIPDSFNCRPSCRAMQYCSLQKKMQSQFFFVSSPFTQSEFSITLISEQNNRVIYNFYCIKYKSS